MMKQVNINSSEWGTFKDSLKAPIHGWFTYPAGFSYKAVEYAIKRFCISSGQTIYDPFLGSGTTNLVAKTHGIHSIGVEAHPFVCKIAEAKLDWSVTQPDVMNFVRYCEVTLHKKVKELQSIQLEDEFPELLLKCYQAETLYDLWGLRELLQETDLSPSLYQFFFVALTSLLRSVSTAATGWPYIAPRVKKVSSLSKDVLTEFRSLSWKMICDVEKMKLFSGQKYLNVKTSIFNNDSRDTRAFIADQSANHVFTSPPYLNNFDYADRTRLELYFWGEAKTWKDISTQIRAKLMTSATTQINRSDSKYTLSHDLAVECPEVYDFLVKSSAELNIRRKEKGGKKSYDLMVAGYFNDIHLVLKDVCRVLKSNATAIFVLGDSAPYGVHIPTDELIGQIGLGVGFSSYDIEILRQRGGKWKDNPQRHSIPLRETIVRMEK